MPADWVRQRWQSWNTEADRVSNSQQKEVSFHNIWNFMSHFQILPGCGLVNQFFNSGVVEPSFPNVAANVPYGTLRTGDVEDCDVEDTTLRTCDFEDRRL